VDNVFHYRNGQREPFDPRAVADNITRCLFCHRPIVVVGIFCPTTPEGVSAVVRLRKQALRPYSDPGIAYGLCRKHARKPNTTKIEAAILAEADRVVVQ